MRAAAFSDFTLSQSTLWASKLTVGECDSVRGTTSGVHGALSALQRPCERSYKVQGDCAVSRPLHIGHFHRTSRGMRLTLAEHYFPLIKPFL